MWKKIGIGVAVLLLLIAGGGFYLYSNLDSIIKNAMQNYGSQATQTSVTVGSFSLSLTSGSGTISGITVSNPAGYNTPQAIGVGSISVQLDTSTISGTGPIVIKEVEIGQPQVTYEVGAGGSNLTTIQHNVEAYAAAEAGRQSTSASASAPARKLIISNLYIRQGRVSISASILKGRSLNVPLPEIHLTNIGQNGGATPAQIGAQVLGAIARKGATTGASALLAQLGNAAGDALRSAGSGFKSLTGF